MTATYYAIRSGPDKNPAHGEIIARAEAHGSLVPPEIAALWVPGEVAIGWVDDKPIRHLPEESLARLRHTRLRTKLQREMPLFAEEFEQRERARRPEFYAGKRQPEPPSQAGAQGTAPISAPVVPTQNQGRPQ